MAHPWRGRRIGLLALASVVLALAGGAGLASGTPTPGDLDTSFLNPDVGPNVFAQALQADGKVLIGGSFTTVGGVGQSALARLNSDGTRDTGFNPSLDDWALAIAQQPDGKVIVGGAFRFVGGVGRARLARLNADGTLDTTFADPLVGPFLPADAAVWVIALQPDGKVLIGGRFASVGGQNRRGLARLNADGTLDTTFGDAGLDVASGNNYKAVRSIALQPDGKVLIGGTFASVGGQARANVARVNADGTLDTTFADPLIVDDTGGQVDPSVASVVLQPDGKVLVAGRFLSVGGTPRRRVARLNADGTRDTGFGNPAPDNSVYSIALQADGKFMIAGVFGVVNFNAGNVTVPHVARFNSDGSRDTAFVSPLANDPPGLRSVLLQPDGKAVLGGPSVWPVATQAETRVLRIAATAPQRGPSAPSASPGPQRATVSWTAVPGEITSYTATAVEDPSKTCTTQNGAATSCVVPGLTDGTSYTFTVKAANGFGLSPASVATAAVTPGTTVPDAPTAALAVAGNAQATVSWTAPASDGGSAITSYTATAVEDSGRACTAVAPATTCTITGLSNGSSYTFTVTATNALGASTASSPSAAVVPVNPASAAGEAVVGQVPTALPATPVAPVVPVAPPLALRAPRQQGGAVVTTGTVPPGATSVVQVANYGGRTANAFSFGMRESARITTRCAIVTTSGARTFTCRARLGAGTWTLTTQARAGSVVLAQSVRRVRVKARAPQRVAVTG
jgi:uncharacterized delta-60 repeat protein